MFRHQDKRLSLSELVERIEMKATSRSKALNTCSQYCRPIEQQEQLFDELI
jgi:hypothetical protein